MSSHEAFSDVYAHVLQCDWFASDEHNVCAAQCFRGFCRVAAILSDADFEQPGEEVDRWLGNCRLRLDDLGWESFILLNSTVGDLMRLCEQSHAISDGDRRVEQRSFQRGTSGGWPEPGKLLSSGKVDEHWIGYLRALKAECCHLRDEIQQLPADFAHGRALLHRGLLVALQVLAASRVLGYAEVLWAKAKTDQSPLT
jgi:hypothetical protein